MILIVCRLIVFSSPIIIKCKTRALKWASEFAYSGRELVFPVLQEWSAVSRIFHHATNR